MIDARDLEVQQAQENPSIISGLSGAPTQADTNITPPPSPIPQEATQAAQGLSSDLYGSGFVSGGDEQRESQMQELFRIDQAMEQNYNPIPTPEWYTPNPADQAGFYGQVGGQLGSNIGASTRAIGGAEDAYQTAVGSLVDRFTDFYKMQKDEERDKEDRDYKRKLDQFDMEMEIAKISGGSVTNPFTGEKVAIPIGAGEAAKPLTEAQFGRQTEQTIIDEIKDPATSLQQIISNHPELDPIQIADMNERIWGPLKESDEQIRQQFRFDPSQLLSRQGMEEEVSSDPYAGTEMSNKSRTDVANYEAYLMRLNDIRNDLDELTGGQENVALRGYGTPGTGFFSQMLGTGGTDVGSVTRQKMETLRQDVRKKLFGTVLTEGEIKESKKTLPGQGIEEGANYNRLGIEIQKKENEMTTLLSAFGVPDEIIQQRLQATQGGGGQVTMQAPDGTQYTVDESEAAEAEANGWRRL